MATELSEILRNNRYGWSAKRTAERAKEKGIHLPYGTIATFFAGNNTWQPSDQTLEGLSKTLGISMRRLEAATGRVMRTTAPVTAERSYTPPAEISSLTVEQQAALDTIIKSMAAAA